MQPDQPAADNSPNPTVSTGSNGNGSKRKLLLLGGGLVVLILIVIAVIVLAGGKSTPTDSTTTTKNGKTYVSNADTSNVAIKGIVLDASLASGYAQQSLKASDLASLKSTVASAGLSDYLSITGETEYGTTQQDGGDLVDIYWGTTGKSYDAASYVSKYNAYEKVVAAKTDSSVTLTTADAASVKLQTSSGKSYTVPCNLVTETFSGDTPFYQITCEGRLPGTNGFISYSTISQDQTEVQTALNKFVAGSKIEL
jgi:hypothetical protein